MLLPPTSRPAKIVVWQGSWNALEESVMAPCTAVRNGTGALARRRKRGLPGPPSEEYIL